MNEVLRRIAARYTIPLTLLAGVLYVVSVYNYLLFHSIAEGFSIVVAIAMFMVAWHTWTNARSMFLLFLGIAYVFVAGIDGLHLLAYKGMGVFENPGTNLATQFWVAARGLQAASLLAAPFFIGRRVKPRAILAAFATVTAILIAAILWWRIFPTCFVEGEGLTPFKKVFEYTVSLAFAGSLCLLGTKKSKLNPEIFTFISLSLILTLLSELSFTLYRDAYGFMNFVGHMLKLAAFFMMYRGLVVGVLEKPMDVLLGELNAANAELEDREEEFRQMFELSGVGKAVMDQASGRFLRANRQLCGITGYTRKALLGLTCGDLRHPDDQGEGGKCDNHAHPSEWVEEQRWIRKDGSVICVNVFRRMVRRGRGRPPEYIADIVDVTDRRNAAERLNSSLEKQAGELADTIETLENVSGEKEHIQSELTQRQQALEAIYSIAATFGTSIDAIFDQVVVSLADIMKASRVAITLMEEGQLRIAALMEDGTLRHDAGTCPEGAPCRASLAELKVQISGNIDSGKHPAVSCAGGFEQCSYLVVPIRAHDISALGTICVIDDKDREFNQDDTHLVEIFARYVSRELVRISLLKELGEAENMKRLGQLTSGVAHEVRNPLNAILAIIEALFQDIGDNPEYQEYLEHIRNQGNRLSVLMRDLLELGRPVRSSEMQVVAIDEMTRTAIQLWKRSSPSGSRKVDLVAEPEMDRCKVRVDSLKMQQVIFNFLENACNHSPDDAPLEVHVGVKGDSFVRISVIDRGNGLAEGDLMKVFDPFFTTRKHGTGLGLSIVRHIARQHGGDVRLFNNAPPPGATAYVQIPTVRA